MGDHQAELLVVVFDCSHHWALIPDTLNAYLSGLGVVLKAFLAMKALNRVCIVGTRSGCSKVLLGETEDHPSRRPLHEVSSEAISAIRSFIASATSSSTSSDGCGIGAALCRALCWLRRHRRSLFPRFLCLGCSPERPPDLPPLSSALRTLISMHAPLHCVWTSVVPSSPPLLTYAALSSRGSFVSPTRPEDVGLLLLDATCKLLPTNPSANHNLPSADLADPRPCCHCHRRPLRVAHVCSACLALYCEFRPVCDVCGTKFELEPLPSSEN